MNLSELYYNKFLALFVQEYKYELMQETPGYCMKVTGLSLDKLEQLYSLIKELNPSLALYILSENQSGDRYITPTKLIELRNDLNITLLVLIPVNSRTSAEDSYGDATFKELSILPIDGRVLDNIFSEIPEQFKPIIKELFAYLKDKINLATAIQYLLYQELNGYTKESIGNGIYLFGLIPDRNLIENIEVIRKRLAFNVICSESLFDFSVSVSERIIKLPIPPDTLQKSIASFLQIESDCKTKHELSYNMLEKYPELNFADWQIPLDPSSNRLTVSAEILPNKDMVENKEDGGFSLSIQSGKKAKLKLRIFTDPIPRESKDLKNFRIILMNVDGMYSIGEVKKIKVTDGIKAYRDVSFEIADGQYEDGSYFFHVIAEDEHGTILNQDDPFRQESVQEQWEIAYKNDVGLTKSQFQMEHRVLLTSDTESFYLKLTDEEPELVETRKAKIDNRLEAYFHYRIEKIRNNKDLDNPEPRRAEWIEGNLLSSIFHIQYNTSHNYQIILSKKLVDIERSLLQHNDSAGYLSVQLSANPTDHQLQSCQFTSADDKLVFSQPLKEKRIELFKAIQESAPESTGVIETFDVFNHIQLIKDYLCEYEKWFAEMIKNSSDSQIKNFLQQLDVVSLSVEMPDTSYSSLKLITPLHPLRLAWLVNLFDLFQNWEKQSYEVIGYQKTWWKNLENLFYGDLVPEVAPLVLVDSQKTNYYQYIGELTYGWGIYADPSNHTNDAFVNIHRQIKSYLASILNIAKEKRIDSDISLSLVLRHLKNYILQHPYTDKLVINIFNPGDAAVFARAMIELEQSGYDLQYEIRLFTEDKLILPGDALRDLINPENQISENAESFSQAAENRLFPKLRFSVNDITDFLKNSSSYQAHITFLVNPFSSETDLIRPEKEEQSFYLNGTITNPVIEITEKENEFTWSRYISDAPLKIPVNSEASIIVDLFALFQTCISESLSANRENSIPAMKLSLGKNDQALLSIVHDISDWVITFDKHMGPEFYDLPCLNKEDVPYLLDYVPSNDTTGVSSYLTTRPTSEIEGFMSPLFDAFNIDISDKNRFANLLEDLRSVGSSLIMQVNSSRNKAFEIVGITLTKRMLQKKGLLEDAFLIPIDLHKNLFDVLKDSSQERADNLLVDILPSKREIVITVIEIKCRKSLGQQEKEDLQDKMNRQILNTIEALKLHFDNQGDRLDRELKTMELKSILLFYLQRAKRYGSISQESYDSYIKFISELNAGYNLRFKSLGIVFDFSAPIRMKKEYLDDTTFYFMGSKVINEILDDKSELNTYTKGKTVQDVDFIDFFEKSERTSGKLLLNNVDAKPKEEKKIAPQETQIKMYSTSEEGSDLTHISSVEEPVVVPARTKNKKEISQGDQPEVQYIEPSYEITIGKTTNSLQYGILGKTITGDRSIAIDLSETNTISLFGVQGGGKSYTIGTISEMVLKQFPNINKLPAPLAGVIFHYSESMDYAPEFTSMIYPNDDKAQLKKLKEVYGVEPDNIEDIVLLVPKDKLEERKQEYPSIEVQPISFNSTELNVQDWMFLLGAVGNDSTYIRQLKAIMRSVRNNISLQTMRRGIANSNLLTNSQKSLAEQRLNFAAEYINDDELLKGYLKPGRLIIVDLRDELIAKEEALGLFVVMLNIFSGVKEVDGESFNKFIVFDEAHKYMNNSDLTDSIVTAIREMRHKGVSLMIASQDPMSLPNAIIELSSIVLLHKFNSPQWVKHVQKSITQLSSLSAPEMAALSPGEAYLWATKSTDKQVMNRPIKISTRPRVTKHGGDTIKAI
ncbi:hypothetical protein DSECCO2_264280 [anaerobic digester metagenome]|uniref:methylation-associated defense system ATP-binding protein MAD8 n=1 Tax=Petrimonas sp. TaxID=2023866 RepID=UPI0030CC42B2